MQMAERERVLKDHRELTQALEGGGCTITPVSEYVTPSEDTPRTLLTSYPGSGKRFTWLVISALTNYDVADDWNFSGKLYENVLTLKTSWPHADSVWSWGDQMDQTILLLRNPRWAIPSYHAMRYELDFSEDWASSLVRIPYIYTGRPSVELWEAWRDENFETELDAYIDHINYWMDGGKNTVTGEFDAECTDNKIDCRPKTVLDFDTFYKENPDTEFYKLGQILEGTYTNETSVQLLAAQAQVCALDKVYDTSALRHNNFRNGEGKPLAPEFRFTSAQLQLMEDKLVEVRNKYVMLMTAEGQLESELVLILNRYIASVTMQKNHEAAIEAEQATA